MINFYKLPEANLYWKIIDEATTVFQIKNSIGSKSMSKTTSPERYNALIVNIPSWVVSNETEFNSIMSEITSEINN